MKVQAKVAIGLLNSNKIEAWISIDQPYGSDWQTANGKTESADLFPQTGDSGQVFEI